MLGLVLLVGFLTMVILALGAAVLARHRAGAAADLAALAAAAGSSASAGQPTSEGQSNSIGQSTSAGQDGCGQAERVATANGVRLVGCRFVGDGSVVVEVQCPARLGSRLLGTADARARAAPGMPKLLDSR